METPQTGFALLRSMHQEYVPGRAAAQTPRQQRVGHPDNWPELSPGLSMETWPSAAP
jgi:hypothetical protein